MNLRSFVIGCLLGISGICSSFAATAVRYPSSSSHLEKGKPFQLVFDKAVVSPSEVGKPADPELTSFSPEEKPLQLVLDKSAVPGACPAILENAKLAFVPPPLKVSSQWITPNVLECRPLAEVPFRASYVWKPAENARFLDGSPVPSVPLRLTGRQTWNFFLSSVDRGWRGSEVYPWESFFVVIPDIVPNRGDAEAGLYRNGTGFLMLPGYCSWEEALEKNLHFTEEPDKKQIEDGIPGRSLGVVVQVATLKEVRNAESYRVRNITSGGNFQNKPDNMPVPGVYVIRPKEMFRHGRDYQLVSRDGSFLSSRPGDAKTGEDVTSLGGVPRFSASGYYHAFSSQEGRLTLEWTLPVLITDLNQFCKNRMVGHVEFFIGDDPKPMVYDEQEEAFVSVIADEDAKTEKKIMIRLDRERLAGMKLIRPQWYKTLPFLVSSDDAVFKLGWKLKGVWSVDDQKLTGKNAEGFVEVRPEDPSLYLDAGNNGVMYAGSRKLKASLSNLKDLTVRGYRIKEGYQQQTLAAYRKIYERDQAADLARTVTDDDQRHFLPAELLAADKEGVLTLDVRGKTETAIALDSLFGGTVEPGMYFIEVEGHVSDPVLEAYKLFGAPSENGSRKNFDREEASYGVQAVVQVTDLGVLHKKTANDIFVYVYSLSSGKAVEKAQVQLLDAGGAVLASVPVERGAVSLPMAGMKGKAAYLHVMSGADSYLSALADWPGKVEMWSFDVKTLPYEWEALGLNPATTAETRLFMFSDRNLYRPSETMHLKGIVRSLLDNRLLFAPVEEVKLTITDSRNREVAVKKVNLSDAGTFDLDFTFPEEETGTYSILASLRMKGDTVKKQEDESSDGEYDSSKYYRKEFHKSNREFRYDVEVAEFKRNEFEVEEKIHELKPGAPLLKADVKATNFTGTPVSRGKVNWALRSVPSNFYPAGYRDYRFGDYRDDDGGYWEAYYGYSSGGSSSFMKQQSAVLDGEGRNTVEFSLDGQSFPRVRRLSLQASVVNGNEQLVKASRSVVWNPASVFVGVRNISSICRQGTPLDLRLIALGLDGKPYAGNDLDLNMTVTRTAFQPTRYEGDEATTVRNDEVRSTVLEKAVTLTPADSSDIRTGGKAVSIPTARDGIYEVTFSGRDAEGREFRTAVKYWVYGSDVSPWEYHDGLKVKIIPDKQLYKPGETARLLIQTPIEGEVMVTVEREKVLRSFARKLTLENPVVEVPLEDADAPNVYVSVFLVKGADLNSRKARNPQLKLGYAALKVQPVRHTLNVQVSPPSGMVRPGSPSVISGVVTDYLGRPVRNAEVCLFAEDEGTLQVIGYRTPMPIRYFYADRPLSVGTWTTLEQILDEDWGERSTDNKGVFIGGGDSSNGSRKAPDALDLRKNFTPCAVWLASLRTDGEGRFQARYSNPDTLTRYRVMAVALAGDSDFGTGESAYVVNKPVMLEPAPPFTATAGDSLNIPVTVSQTGDRKGPWVVTLKSGSAAASVPQPVQTLTLNGNQPETLVFNVKFTQPGEARLTWDICAADDNGNPYSSGVYALLKDTVEHTFEVVPPFPDLRELRCFSLSSGQTLDLPGLVTTPFLKGTPIRVTLGTSPLLYADGSVNYLLHYPYGCLEQLSSSTLPWIYEPLLAKYLPGFKGKSPEDRSRALRSGVYKILKNQLSSGALAYWQGGTEVSEYCPYAALVLTLAREQGVYVPERDLGKLYTYLEHRLSGQPREGLLAAWVLARAGRMPASLLNRLLDHARELKEEDRLYLALAAALSPRAEAKAQARLLMDVSGEEMKSSRCRLLLVLAEMALAPNEHAVREKLGSLIVDRMSGSFGGRAPYSTWISGWDVILLGEYLKGLQEVPLSASFHVDRGGQPLDGTCSISSPAQFLTAVGEKAVLSLPEAGTRVYGMAEARGRSRTQQDGAAVNKGFAVSRVYEKLSPEGTWTPAAEFAVGDLVRITLHVDKSANPLTYVVMEDYLPSAFEAVNPALLSQIPGGRESEAGNEGERWFYWSGWVSHREFLKDRVRFFANSWHGGRFTARYLARVTKSGVVIAPSAKAELMYKPETYGLSIPQKLTVSPGH